MDDDNYGYDRGADRPLEFEDILREQDRDFRWSQEPIDSTEGSDETIVPASTLDIAAEGMIEDTPEAITNDVVSTNATPSPCTFPAPTTSKGEATLHTQLRVVCRQCGNRHREVARDCPWVARLNTGKTTACIYPSNGGAIPDVIRLDTNPCLSLRKYLSDYRGHPLASLRDAYEQSLKRFPFAFGGKIPPWYANEEILPGILQRMHLNLCRPQRPGPPKTGDKPSLLSRIERPDSERTSNSDAQIRERSLAIQEAQAIAAPREVFITGMTESQLNLRDGQGNAFVLNRGAVNAWTR